jgi:hypothetical protein
VISSTRCSLPSTLWLRLSLCSSLRHTYSCASPFFLQPNPIQNTRDSLLRLHLVVRLPGFKSHARPRALTSRASQQEEPPLSTPEAPLPKPEPDARLLEKPSTSYAQLPPLKAAPGLAAAPRPCPRCGGRRVIKTAAYGSQPCHVCGPWGSTTGAATAVPSALLVSKGSDGDVETSSAPGSNSGWKSDLEDAPSSKPTSRPSTPMSQERRKAISEALQKKGPRTSEHKRSGVTLCGFFPSFIPAIDDALHRLGILLWYTKKAIYI